MCVQTNLLAASLADKIIVPVCNYNLTNASTFALTFPSSLTHRYRDKMVAIFQTTFSNTFSWMKMLEFRLRFHWTKVPSINIPALLQIMAATLNMNAKASRLCEILREDFRRILKRIPGGNVWASDHQYLHCRRRWFSRNNAIYPIGQHCYLSIVCEIDV